MKRTPDARKRRSKAIKELIFIIGLASIVYVLSNTYGFFVNVEGDMGNVLITSAFFMAIFSFRRWRELRCEIKEREEAETEWRKAEEALLESEERFRDLYDHAPLGYHEYDRNGLITRVNQTDLEMLGYAREEMVGRPVWEFNVGREIVREQVLEKLAGIRPPGQALERIYRKKDGTTFAVLIEDRLILDDNGRINGIRCTIQDITERKQAEDKYRTILDTTIEGFWIADVQGRFLEVNDAYCRLIGYSRDELLNMRIPDVDALERPEETAQRIQQIMETGGDRFETRHRSKDGRMIDVEISVNYTNLHGGRLFVFVRDITERKRAEESLRQSEENARQLAKEKAVMADIGRIISSTLNIEEVYDRFAQRVREILPFDRIVINTINFKKQTITNVYMAGTGIGNRKVNEIFPLQGSGNAEMVRTKSTLLIQTEDFSEYRERFPMLVSTFESGFRSMMNVPLFSKGQIVGGLLLRSLKSHAYTEKGVRLAERVGDQIAAAVVNAQLFAEQKRTEQKLRESEKRYRNLFEDSMDAIYLTSREGKVLDVNPSALNLFGYRKDEMIGLNSRDTYVHPEDRSKFWEEMKKNGSVRDYEVKLRKRDGTEMECLLNSSAVRAADGSIAGYQGVIRDITDRKKMEQALRESEAKFRDLYDHAPVGYHEYDTAGRITNVNQTDLEMLGYTAEEMMGQPVWKFNVEEETVREYVMAKVSGALPPSKELERTYRRKDGTTCPVLITDRFILDRNNQITSVRVTVRDFTERKRVEGELRKAKEAAEGANRAKSTFLANMSHEIRTPMNAIVGLSHLALKTDLTAKQRDYMDKIRSSAHSLLRLLNDILDLSKIEAGKLDIERTTFYLDEVLTNTSNVLSGKAEEKGLKLHFHTGPDVPRKLIGDPLRLGQILLNLVGNAVKFTENGEIVVSAGVETKEADCVRLRFWVRDTGIGMSEQERVKLFKPFTQADGSMTRKYGGTGLGLAICRELVGRMGGEITVQSESGIGSEFSFVVPLGCPLETRVQERRIPAVTAGLRALVVDDNPMIQGVLKAMLDSMSLQATTVGSGKEALKEIENSKDSYDLILVDWEMPDMNGFETARRIKACLRSHKVPKIFLVSGYGREELMREADVLGLDGFLIKPVSASVLFNTVIETFGCDRSPVVVSRRQELPEGAKNIRGARVLVVEDNEINQQVAREILEGFGMRVEIAANGKIAVERLKKKDAQFDAVLMDLQMPEMDGYEATRVIRSTIDQSTLPIIAMTAHALGSERENCLKSGMNDYVSKPVDPDQLLASLARWIEFGSGPARKTPGDAMPLDPDDQCPGIDMEAALGRLRGNRELLVKLLGDFRRNYGGIVKQIRESLARDDREGARRVVHTLKGVAGNLSAGEVVAAARDLEAALEKGDSAPIDPALDRLEEALRQVLALASRVSQEGTAQKDPAISEEDWPVDGARLAPVLRECNDLLRQNNLSASNQFRLLKELLSGYRSDSSLVQIEDCLGRLNFREARKHLASVAQALGVELT